MVAMNHDEYLKCKEHQKKEHQEKDLKNSWFSFKSEDIPKDILKDKNDLSLKWKDEKLKLDNDILLKFRDDCLRDSTELSPKNKTVESFNNYLSKFYSLFYKEKTFHEKLLSTGSAIMMLSSLNELNMSSISTSLFVYTFGDILFPILSSYHIIQYIKK